MFSPPSQLIAKQGDQQSQKNAADIKQLQEDLTQEREDNKQNPEEKKKALTEIIDDYNRILLSPVLAGEMTIQEIVLNELDWYKEKGIKLHTGKNIAKIDRVKRKVIADDGTEEEYDRLLVATGSTPFMLPIPGNDLPWPLMNALRWMRLSEAACTLA